MSFTFNNVSFREEFPGCEAIQSEYPNLSNLSVDSLEIPRMERRRFLETTRPNTSIEFYVILRGDTPEELEETRDRFMLAYDPTLGPGRLVLDEDPDWFWDMTLADEIVWERLTWECGRAGNSGGYRLAADVRFESFNDAAQRLLDEAWGPTDPPPPPKWVEVGRNYAPNPAPLGQNYVRASQGTNIITNGEDSPSGRWVETTITGDYPASNSAVGPEWEIPLAEGQFPVAVWVKSPKTRMMSFRYWWMSGDTPIGADTYTERFRVEADTPTRMALPAMAPPPGVVASFKARVISISEPWIQGDKLYTGAISTAPDHPWFSGDHAPDGMRSEWLGEPNNSVSVLYKQENAPDDPDLPDVTSIRCEGNTRTWPTVQFTATATVAQTVRVTVGGFTVDVAGPFTAQDTAVLDYDLMRFELFREGVKVASLVPRMSTLDRSEIRPQDGWIPVTVEPVDGGTVSDVKVKPNSRKQ